MDNYVVRRSDSHVKVTNQAFVLGLKIATANACEMILVCDTYQQAKHSDVFESAVPPEVFTALNKDRHCIWNGVVVYLETKKTFERKSLDFGGVVVGLWASEIMAEKISKDALRAKSLIMVEWASEELKRWLDDNHAELIIA